MVSEPLHETTPERTAIAIRIPARGAPDTFSRDENGPGVSRQPGPTSRHRTWSQWPVPDSDTVWVRDRALSVICKVPEREPLALGLKLTLIAQLLLLPAASEPPQVFPVTTKSAEFGPVIVTPEIVKGPIPGLLSVTVLAVVSSPSSSDPKFKFDGLTLAFGAITVAVIATFCGLPEAVSVKVRTAEFGPITLGHKLSVIVQLLPGFSGAMQPPS